jgi:hypothetical protein
MFINILKYISLVLIVSVVWLFNFSLLSESKINAEILSQEITPFLFFVFVNILILILPYFSVRNANKDLHDKSITTYIYILLTLLILNLFTYNILYNQNEITLTISSILYVAFYFNIAFHIFRGNKFLNKRTKETVSFK